MVSSPHGTAITMEVWVDTDSNSHWSLEGQRWTLVVRLRVTRLTPKRRAKLSPATPISITSTMTASVGACRWWSVTRQLFNLVSLSKWSDLHFAWDFVCLHSSSFRSESDHHQVIQPQRHQWWQELECTWQPIACAGFRILVIDILILLNFYIYCDMEFFNDVGGDPLKPSLFELVAQEQLRDLLQPALKYVIAVSSQNLSFTCSTHL